MEERIEMVTETKGWEQLGILVLDGSGSMDSPGITGQPKAVEVNQAVRDLISRFKVSNVAANFLLSVITYDHRVNKDFVKPTPILQLDEFADYNPLNGHGGETAIGDALEAAHTVAEDFLAGQASFPRSVMIMLMTDGQNNKGQDPIAASDKIKTTGKRIAISAVGYGKGDEVDSITLKKIISPNGDYTTKYDPEGLRNFFTKSMSTKIG